MSHVPLADADHAEADAYIAVQRTPEFIALRKKFRSFVFPATAFFLVWYFLYVFMAAFAHDFMEIKVVGLINIGLIFGLLQFVTTFALTIIYVRWANREFDPTADKIRHQMETGTLSSTGETP